MSLRKPKQKHGRMSCRSGFDIGFDATESVVEFNSTLEL